MDHRAATVMKQGAQSSRLRVVTYNIHKCRGFDRRVLPKRIISVLQELNADVMCLQEVVNAPDHGLRYDQAGDIARAFPDFTPCFGANRKIYNGTYGNLTLSRLPVLAWKNTDITQKREPRGVLRTDLSLGGDRLLHTFNVHLGTGYMERRYQAKRLMSQDILGDPQLHQSRLVLGDFNEWTNGLTTRLMRESFSTFQPRHALKFPNTFPGMLPFTTLDHCYYEPPLELQETMLWRSRTALVASDHLPLLADFQLPAFSVS
ncbi:endonuclease/exonuclease/phosphatase family protein [Acidicapsa dinghuensis]|uniref:Endonuclease/exonuclease/phosphatase family protein n=1 Tax=Acidicapsa dinghuensis TaxID=2218256 RepID=A0ABW1ECC5_9BACT|nr:endonuclease/exonuclease/phosphatase family protein [Acidicapsa dinghuensis]